MRRVTTLGLTLLLIGALVASIGCSNQQQQAQEKIKSANPNVAKGNEQVTVLRSTWVRIKKLPDNPTGYKQGIALSKSGTNAAKTAEAEYKKALAAIQAAKKLDVSPEYKKYIGMKESALNARVEGLALSAQRFDQISRLYAAAIARNISAWKKASAKISAISVNIQKLPDSDKLDAAANAYAKKNKIGV